MVGRCEHETAPVWRAANFRQAHTARLLGETADRDSGSTPLQAAWQRFPDVAKVLLQNRADAHKVRNYGVTPFLFAVQMGSLEVAQVLLEHRALVNKGNKKKVTPLHVAVDDGHVAFVRNLLQNRANTTFKNQVGLAPLATARHQGHEEVAMLLEAERDGARCSCQCSCQRDSDHIPCLCRGVKRDLGLVRHPFFQTFRVAVRDRAASVRSLWVPKQA